MMYLGSLGRMIGVRCSSSLAVDYGDRYTLSRTVEGGVRAQVRPVAPRQWSVGWGDLSTPADLTVLQDFVNGAWGAGPWWFLSDEAVNTNILTPRQALLLDREQRDDWIDGGPVQVSDGTIAPSSLLVGMSSGWDPVFRRLPVRGGQPVTWTAEVEGDGTVAPWIALAFYDAAGANILGAYQEGQRAVGMQRVSLTRVAPDDAVMVAVGVRYQTKRLARPQLTWTATPPPVFSEGRGCANAIVHQVRQGVVLTWPERTLLNADFVVSEVI